MECAVAITRILLTGPPRALNGLCGSHHGAAGTGGRRAARRRRPENRCDSLPRLPAPPPDLLHTAQPKPPHSASRTRSGGTSLIPVAPRGAFKPPHCPVNDVACLPPHPPARAQHAQAQVGLPLDLRARADVGDGEQRARCRAAQQRARPRVCAAQVFSAPITKPSRPVPPPLPTRPTTPLDFASRALRPRGFGRGRGRRADHGAPTGRTL